MRAPAPLVLALLVGGAVLPACDPGLPGADDMRPAAGSVTVSLTSQPYAQSAPTLTRATMHIEHLGVVGDVGPGPPPMGPPVSFDALAAMGQTLSLPMQPQGLYSRVVFGVGDISLEGSYRGVPYRARLALFREVMVNLSAATPQELGPGQNVVFTVGVDPNTWFQGDPRRPGNPLDRAVPSMDGQIECDPMHNSDVAMQLTDAVAHSFYLQ